MSPPSSFVGPSSGLRIVLGVACLVLGVAALAWPNLTLVVLAVILGLQLVIAGLRRSCWASGCGQARPGYDRSSWCSAGSSLSRAGWLIDGVSEIVSGLRTGRSGAERFTMIAFGVARGIAALILFVVPDLSLILLSQIASVVLIVLSVVALVGAILARRSLQTAPT